MKLFYMETLNPRKACAVAKYLNSPVEFVHVDATKGENKTPEFLAINPNAKLPVLEDGPVRLWEANAIMCYLARAARSDLWPDDERQVEVLRWLSWNADHFTRHAGSLYFQNLIKPLFGASPDAAAVKEATEQFNRFAHVLDDHLRDRKFLLGDTLTIADFAVGSALPYADKAKIPLAEFPEVRRWHDRLNDIPAWREPFPVRPARAA